MDQGVAALLGALIGGVLTAAATIGADVRRERSQARNLAIATAGEACAVAEMVRRRQWANMVAECYVDATQGSVAQFSAQLPPEILPVARSAQQSAGVLPGNLPALVPRLVMLADSWLAVTP